METMEPKDPEQRSSVSYMVPENWVARASRGDDINGNTMLRIVFEEVIVLRQSSHGVIFVTI